MTSFTELLYGIQSDADGHRVSAPSAWTQGRTLYGGLSAALRLEAVARDHPDLPQLRSAQIAFVGLAGGEVTMSTTLLRRGKSSAFANSDLSVDGAVATRALFCFGGDRPSIDHARLEPAPNLPRPSECPPVFKPDRRPNFAQNFDMRLASGAPPASGASDAENFIWVRHEDSKAPLNMVSLLALADAAPPAAMSLFTEPVMISTMTWTVDVLAPDALSPDGWWLCRSHAETISNGYAAQAMSIWSSDGVPVILGRQMVAVFSSR